MNALDMGTKSGEVIDHPAVTKAKADKAEKRAKAAAEKEATEADAPEVVFSTVTEFAKEARASWEAQQSAREKRTAIGKRFADRVKTANEKLASAVTENPKNELAKLITARDAAKARAKKLAAEIEEVGPEDDTAVGKAYRSRARVLDERAEEKSKAGERVTKKSARFEAVMSAQLKFAL